MSLVWTGFLLGLFGSVHCAGMCGPIALSLLGRDGSQARHVAGRLLYNSGRVVTYMGLGLILGLAGAGVVLAGYQQALSVIAGGFLLIFALLPSQKFTRFLHGIPGVFRSWFGGRFARLMKSGSLRSLFGIGLINGLLPCGFVYLGLAGALATGSLAGSMLYMALFGIGTIPVMLGMSLATGFLGPEKRLRLQRIMPYAVAVVGILLILRGLALGIPFISPVLADAGTAASEICH